MGKDTVRAGRKFHNKNTKATKRGPTSTADERRFTQIGADAAIFPAFYRQISDFRDHPQTKKY
jgi:hypothetical protein